MDYCEILFTKIDAEEFNSIRYNPKACKLINNKDLMNDILNNTDLDVNKNYLQIESKVDNFMLGNKKYSNVYVKIANKENDFEEVKYLKIQYTN